MRHCPLKHRRRGGGPLGQGTELVKGRLELERSQVAPDRGQPDAKEALRKILNCDYLHSP